VGYGNVKVVCGDGGLGYAEGAPYDRIIVTVGAWDVVPAWWDQLSLGGRLVVPLNTVGQFEHSIAFVNVGDHLESASVANCSFMLMRGQFQGPTRLITIGPDSSLWVRGQQAGEVDPDGLYELLAGPSKDVSTGIEVSGDDWWGLSTWLAVHRQPLFTMFASGDSAERGIVPGFVQEVGGRRMRATQGIVAKGTMCLLTRLPAAPSEETPSSDEPLELFVRTYGRDDALGRGITDLLVAWDRAGRPEAQFAGFKALRKDTEYEPAADESVVEKRWTNLVATIGVP
jgi:protein-L-isoaspartate(D-aspartate) O-methyltransferase